MKNLLGHEVGSGIVAPIGAAIVGRSTAELLAVDEDGQLWTLASGDRKELVRWCLQRAVRVYPSVGHLARELQAGRCIGLLSRFGRAVAWPRVAGDLERSCDLPASRVRIDASATTDR